MEHFLRFAYSSALYFSLPLVIFCMWYRLKLYKEVVYSYPLAGVFKSRGLASFHPHKKILFFLRSLVLLGLALLVGKPQLVDSNSHMLVEGIDIILVMDVSGSMNVPHHSDDERSRIDVAKDEAIHFINKRNNDAIGIVVFGNDAISRSPLTVDKTFLKEIVNDVEIGMINPEGTLLATALITAANRLKQSTAKSKVMIVLTDGEPSEYDADPMLAIKIAKKLGIKIYTVGIGDDQEVLIQHPFYGKFPIKTTLNKKLLTLIAQETGGKFFEAKKASDMRLIYDTIDTLEKTKIEAPIFSSYHDIFIPFIWILCALVCFEIIMSALWWFSL